MTTDPRDAEQARKALHKAEKEHCSNFDKGAVFHWAEKGAYVLKADAQAEIARLTAALAEAEAAAEGALMILVQTQAERDAALARESALLASNQSKRELLYKLTGAQSEVIHMRNRFDTAVATARAEGRKDGLREAAAMCDDTAQEALEESGAESRAIWTWFRGQRDAILAAAEREAQG